MLERCVICTKRIGFWSSYNYTYEKEKKDSQCSIKYIYDKFRYYEPTPKEKYDYAHDKCIKKHGRKITD